MNDVIEHNKYEAPITFDWTLEQARQIQSDAEKLTLTDWQDETTYKTIKKERAEVNRINKAIYQRKRELKTEAETWLKKVEDRAKALKLPLDMAEAHLSKQLAVRDNEIARQKQEAEEREKRETERRVNLAMAINWQKPMYLLQAMTLEDFERDYAAAKVLYDEAQRVEAENKRKLEEFQQEQQEKLNALERENRELKKKQDEELRIRAAEADEAKRVLAAKEAEERKVKEEADALAKDDAMMKEVQEQFPRISMAWAEIVRLRKEAELF